MNKKNRLKNVDFNGNGNIATLTEEIYRTFVDDNTDRFLNQVLESKLENNVTVTFDVDKWIAHAEHSWKNLEQAFADGDIESYYTLPQKAKRRCLRFFNSANSRSYAESLRAEVMRQCISAKLERTTSALNNLREELKRANEDHQHYKIEINNLLLAELKSADAAASVAVAIDSGKSRLEDIAKQKSSAFKKHDIKTAEKLMEDYILFEREVDFWERKKQAALINADICNKKREIVNDHFSLVYSYKELLSSAEIMTSLLKERIMLALEMYDRFGNPDKIKAGLSTLEDMRNTREKLKELYNGVLATNTRSKINQHEIFSAKDKESAKQLIKDCEKDKINLFYRVMERRTNLLNSC